MYVDDDGLFSRQVEPANVRPLEASSADNYDSNVKYFIKKSMTDNKQVTMRQFFSAVLVLKLGVATLCTKYQQT